MRPAARLIAFPATLLAALPAWAQETTSLPVDGSIIDTITRVLPERVETDGQYLDPAYDASISFTSDANASVTFISEGAGYRNSLGYFSFQDGAFDSVSFGEIDSNGSGNITVNEVSYLTGVTETGMLFPNASGSGGFAGSGGSLNTGDTVPIGDGSVDLIEGRLVQSGTTFTSNDNLGFFVVANGWNGSGVDSWDNSREKSTYWSVDLLNPENSAGATADSVSAFSRHVALVNVEDQNTLILGFEDLKRPYGDNDFNDAVFVVNTSPADDGSLTPAVPALPAEPVFDTSKMQKVYSAPVEGNALLLSFTLLGALGFYRKGNYAGFRLGRYTASSI
ncbi:MAG: DUF4114 domain-containing protein [Alphaproteobacteria bacterium]|nr:DUF4114 domain-containing protein [Alphaproteobacteria bacterium]